MSPDDLRYLERGLVRLWALDRIDAPLEDRDFDTLKWLFLSRLSGRFPAQTWGRYWQGEGEKA